MADTSRMVVIGCVNSAGVALEGLREAGRDLPGYVEWLDVPCGASVDDLLILKAFEAGAERVLVLVCNSQACRSLDGNRWAEKRTNAARALLQEIGIPTWRLQFRPIAPNMPADLLSWVQTFEEPAPTPQEEVSA